MTDDVIVVFVWFVYILQCNDDSLYIGETGNLKSRLVKHNDGSASSFSAEESEHLVVRADLLIQLQKALAARGLTQAKAAKILHVTQPRVSDLLRGRIDLFSTDSLIDMLARLGVQVRFIVKASRPRVA